MDETTELIRCAYCGKERPRREMHQKKLIYRTSGWTKRGKWGQVVAERMEWYCADRPCAAHNQMAHEG